MTINFLTITKEAIMKLVCFICSVLILASCNMNNDAPEKPEDKQSLQDKELCKKIDAEALEKSKVLTDTKAWNSYVEQLQSKKPKDCILVNDGLRF